MNWKEQEMNTLGWSDLWEEVCADRGPTFPANQGNVCAVPARLDRILTCGVNCQDSSMTRLGTSKIPGTDAFPSDHYGRCCTSLTCPVHSPPGRNVNVTREDVQGIVVVLGSQLQQHSLTPTFDGSFELKGQ